MYTEQRNLSMVESEIERVEERIKKCLLVYMSRDETVNALKMEDNIDPIITDIVWRRLVEENKEFFEAYNLMLIVKDQITRFNSLLDMQLQLTCGSPVPPLNCDSGFYAPFQPGLVVNNGLPDTFFSADVSGNTPLAQHSNWSGFDYAGTTHLPTNGMVQTPMPSSQCANLPTNGMVQTPMPSSQGVNVSEQILRNLSLAQYAGGWGINCGDKHSLESIIDDGFNREDFGSE